MSFKSKVICPHCNSKLELGFEYFNQNQSIIYFCKACMKMLAITDSPIQFENRFNPEALVRSLKG